MMETLRALCRVTGITGEEGAVAGAIADILAPRYDTQIDALGNLTALPKGAGREEISLLLTAPMDEPGVLITDITKEGLLRFTAIGPLDSRVLLGKTLQIGKMGRPGVIGTKAMHMQSAKERDTPQPLDKLFIDIGATTKEEAQAVVSPGDSGSFAPGCSPLGEQRLAGPSLPTRACCALLLELVRESPIPGAALAFTVQNRLGSRAAAPAVYGLAPQTIVSLAPTEAGDFPGGDKEQSCSLGKGGALSVMDRNVSYTPALSRRVLAQAKDAGIPVQLRGDLTGDAAAGVFGSVGSGAKVLSLGLPCRYWNTPTACIDTRDLTGTLALLRQIIESTKR